MQYPKENEYAPYFKTYLQHVPEADPIELLEKVHIYAMDFWSSVAQEFYNYAYADGKWTLKELIQHILDTEQILNYRALRFLRNDNESALPFDEDAYVDATSMAAVPWDYLMETLRLQRQLSIHFYKGISEEESLKGGSKIFPCTVRSIAAILAGHELHHIYVVQERYLKQAKQPFKL